MVPSASRYVCLCVNTLMAGQFDMHGLRKFQKTFLRKKISFTNPFPGEKNLAWVILLDNAC